MKHIIKFDKFFEDRYEQHVLDLFNFRDKPKKEDTKPQSIKETPKQEIKKPDNKISGKFNIITAIKRNNNDEIIFKYDDNIFKYTNDNGDVKILDTNKNNIYPSTNLGVKLFVYIADLKMDKKINYISL